MPEMSRANLIKLLAVLFVIFVGLGWAISSVFSKYNSKPETTVRQETVTPGSKEVSLEGIITFVDPNLSPGDGISFSLNDPLGKDIIYLKATDQKLEVSEGHFVTVFGEKKKTEGGVEYLLVSKVVLKNGSN